MLANAVDEVRIEIEVLSAEWAVRTKDDLIPRRVPI